MTAGKQKSDKNPTNVSSKLGLKDPLLRRLSSAAAVTHSFLQANDLFLSPSQSLRLESLISSLPISPSPSPSPAVTTATWFNRFLTSATEDEDDPRWCLCFRMSKSTFFSLYSILTPASLPSFAATIFRLAHGASYESLVHRFGFDSTSQASRSFFTVCKLINEKLSQQLDDPKPDFSPNLLPNCCGVLGFGRFEVKGKLLGAKGSILVQALVDSNGRFVDISAGWPSTMKLEAIFRQTKLFSIAEEVLSGAPTKLGNGVLVPRYILGDSCLPLLPWLVTPYDLTSNEEEEESFREEFNNVVHTGLHTVEIAFAKVRARWQILDKKWKPETIEFLPFVITTCCLLHNFLVNSGDDDDDSLEECVNGCEAGEMRKDEKDEEEKTRRFEGEAYIGSRRIRDAIAENLSRVSSLS
ncbi:protein ANTAGONIST OF LIKE HETEROCHROMATIN PROTEIN 1 [Capsella rubella]|uniref:protein ANTAGONIST OF LIKE HETEROCHROMATIN PROTEIN 1 n=1 Tax=Capsella rubella TaxID=81985 RepID=UPI000CD58223|nr:protein ANTAGONIST OF LIKE HETEROCHROMATIN PROTEIN 1 [Capsella rubella]